MRRERGVIETIRDAAASHNARLTYAVAHDHFEDMAQSLVLEGRIPEAEGAHQFALIALKAYRAEIDDPEPKR